jgi:cytochrome c oxidase subunit IV
MDDAEYNNAVSGVWRVTVWLSIITVLEVAFALIYLNFSSISEVVPRWLLNLTFIIASLGKAFFIIGEFMHLKYEKRVLMISLAVPLIFLVWAIIAFLYEANAWHNMRGF